MEDKDLLELCIKISGSFEARGNPSYTDLAGNFDGQGMSAGILQWNAGQGTLQQLVQAIGSSMGWDKAQTWFKSDIHHFSVLKPAEAIQWCRDHYLAEGKTDLDDIARQCWRNFLGQTESITAQINMASRTVLARAESLASKFCPDYPESTRVLSFFFDLVTQSGGMQNSKGSVEPATGDVDVSGILNFAQSKDLKCAGIWEIATQDDPKARLLLHYAYERSKLSNPQYVWDACSRRGSIACRGGIVHETTINFTNLLD